ncbi:hypothetical protein [Alcanivorax sp.]|uniref:hypothetical protein n=1 Tax=Alcanivorax sp. TaxID=1872427 RepID=UPI000C0D2690|nr:hypothetical protein [Alcanivorax sp.]PHR68471.1 MAG: hypothetical protein COA55_00175 [Alcanivorax sp.]
MGIKRLQYELKRLEALELRHIIDEMASHGDSKVVMAFNGTQSQPVAAVALISGPDTERYLKALELAQVATGGSPEGTDDVTPEMISAGMAEWDKQHKAGERQWPVMLESVFKAMFCASKRRGC